jgi:hypothetical protein
LIPGIAGKKSPVALGLQHFADPEIKAFGSEDGGHAIAWLETGA